MKDLAEDAARARQILSQINVIRISAEYFFIAIAK